MLAPHYFDYTAIYNVLQNTVTQVPIRLEARGLPLGVQVVGQHWQVDVPFAVARVLELAFGGWVAPAVA